MDIASPESNSPQGGKPSTAISPKRKRWLACDFCRSKKVRCDGGNPCAYCVRHGQKCITSKSSKRPNLMREKSAEIERMAARLAKVEFLLYETQKTRNDDSRRRTSLTASFLSPPTTTVEGAASLAYSTLLPEYSADLHDQPDIHQARELPPLTAFEAQKEQHNDFRGSYAQQPPLVDVTQVDHTSSAHRFSLDRHSEGVSRSLSEDCHEEQEWSSVYSAETCLEYQGPRSFLSICSPIGIDWVNERVSAPSFKKAATKFLQDVTRRLKMTTKISAERISDPDHELAWKYTEAFFTESNEAVFGIIQRPWFETRLRAHMFDSKGDSDAAWYALRNVVYATGCRLDASTHSSYTITQKLSWDYFANALSIYSEILLLPSSLVGVQALVLMAYYAEGISCPQIEYILCSNALRLACSKGLHRRPATSWNLTEPEMNLRNWIFWAIYCLDKNIASRSGRPSNIDDDLISCEIPIAAPEGCSMDVEACKSLIKLHQLYSIAEKSLTAESAFRQNPTTLLQTVDMLDQKLSVLREEISSLLPMTEPIVPARLPPDMSFQVALTLQFTYHALTFNIHRALTYPWSRGIISLRYHSMFRTQVERSHMLGAAASRAVILSCRHVNLHVGSPLLLAYLIPAYACVQMFIHILQAPHLSTAKSDLLLLELGASHFVRLEIATDSQISTPFMRDMLELARSAVKCAPSALNGPTTIPNLPLSSELMASSTSTPGAMDVAAAQDGVMNEDGFSKWFDNTQYSVTDMDMWSCLLPIVDESPTSIAFTR